MRLLRLILALAGWIVALTTAATAQPPSDWTVNPTAFEHFMTVTSDLAVDGEVASDTNTVIAAFIDGECRGVASGSEVDGRSVFFLMIYGSSGGATANLRAYYAPQDTVIALDEPVVFQPGGSLGSPDDPFSLHASLGVSNVRDEPGIIPAIRLFPNYPNPFNPSTTIRYILPSDMFVELTVFNLNGQRIKILVHEQMASGEYRAVWNGRDEEDIPVSAGVYLYRLRTSKFQVTRKMLLVR